MCQIPHHNRSVKDRHDMLTTVCQCLPDPPLTLNSVLLLLDWRQMEAPLLHQRFWLHHAAKRRLCPSRFSKKVL